jgi:cell division protein ZapA
MNSDMVPVNIHILDKEYMVSCPESERDALIESARFLDSRMKAARGSAKVLGAERLAVMTALNITHEFLQQKQAQETEWHSLGQRLKQLEQKIDAAFGRLKQQEALD